MKEIIRSIQDILQEEVPGLLHVDEDTGQLDYYSTNFPVKFPCGLIDITSVVYSDIIKSRRQEPVNLLQMGEASTTITIANQKLTNTSGFAPISQKDNAWSIYDLIEEVHTKLQGFNPTENCGALIRKSLNKIKRDDGVQEFAIVYSFGIHKV